MSNIPKEREIDRPDAAIPWAFGELTKQLWTAMPGIVEEYDAATRRARIRPAIMGVLTEGAGTMRRQPIVNVPVVTPSCGGFGITVCLQPGDAVLLVWSMRGISGFLREFEESVPLPLGSMLSATDCIALPGFGPSPDGNFMPASGTPHGFSEGVSIQSETGETHVSVSEEEVRVRGSMRVSLQNQDSTVMMDGDTVTIDATTIDLTFTNGWPKDIEDRLTAGGL